MNYQRNTQPFANVVKGARGRKVAYTNVESITIENVVRVINSCLAIFNENKIATRYLWNYLHGDQPILYKIKEIRPEINSKVEVNRAEEIVKFKNGQTYGEPIQYVSRGRDNIALIEAVDRLNNYMEDAGKHEKDITHGEWQSATGTSFVAVQMNMNGNRLDEDDPFNLVIPTPLDTFIIYSKRTQKPLLAVQECEDENNERYLVAYSKGEQFVIVKDEVVQHGVHTYGDIPIIEYPNNAERISDIEVVIELLDAINETQSDRVDGIKQFVQALMVFKNCAIDEDTFNRLRQAGALSIKSTREMDSSVDMLVQELSQSDTQTVIDSMWDDVQSILGIPNRQNEGTGDRVGATELKGGWDFSKQRARLKDPYVINAEKRLCKIVLNIVNRANNDCNLNVKDFEVKIQHSPIDNLSIKANSLKVLIDAGIDPQSAIITVGLFSDPEKVYLASKDELDIRHFGKAVETLSALLSAGVSVEEACKKTGFNPKDIDASRWETQPEETIEVVE